MAKQISVYTPYCKNAFLKILWIFIIADKYQYLKLSSCLPFELRVGFGKQTFSASCMISGNKKKIVLKITEKPFNRLYSVKINQMWKLLIEQTIGNVARKKNKQNARLLWFQLPINSAFTRCKSKNALPNMVLVFLW